MEIKPAKPWYKKKLYVVFFLLLGAVFVYSATDTSSTSTPSIQNQQPVQGITSVAEQIKPAPVDKLSNDSYYINSSGSKVHSPAYSESVPVGATARCKDGIYSFSQHRSGTCSGHGGVAKWL